MLKKVTLFLVWLLLVIPIGLFLLPETTTAASRHAACRAPAKIGPATLISVFVTRIFTTHVWITNTLKTHDSPLDEIEGVVHASNPCPIHYGVVNAWVTETSPDYDQKHSIINLVLTHTNSPRAEPVDEFFQDFDGLPIRQYEISAKFELPANCTFYVPGGEWDVQYLSCAQ